MKHPYFWKTTVVFLQILCVLGIFGICYAGYYKAGSSIFNMAQIDGGKYENTEYYLQEVNSQFALLHERIRQEEMFQKDESGRMTSEVNMNDYGYYNIKYTVETLLNAEENWSDYDISIYFDQDGEIPDEENIMLISSFNYII